MNVTRMKAAVVTLASATLLFACQNEAVTEPDNTPKLRPLTSLEAKTVSSSNDFAYRAFGKIQESTPTENIFISPFSVSAALTMTYNGADGPTKEAMRQALGFQPLTDEEISESYKSLTDLLMGIDRTVTFTSANSLWHGQQYQLQAPFVQKNTQYFDARVQGLNFSDPNAKSVINNWVEQKTNGKIKDLIKATSSDHVLFLVNALYFKGSWSHAFDKKLTQPGLFRKADGSTSSANFMTLRNGQYQLYTDATKQLIDLPYGNKQYSMTMLVPQGQTTVQDLMQELNGPNLATWLANATPSSIDLHMPKFRLEYEKVLNKTLTQLGMGVAFRNDADFSRMVQGISSGLFISQVQHNTFVEVDEEGTEAAAATSVGIGVTSLPPSVRVDRPFVFLIREKSTNTILFVGQLMNP